MDQQAVTVAQEKLATRCDGKEQYAFEAWAAAERYDMNEHPLHYLFLNEKTAAARDGWAAGLKYASDIAARLASVSSASAEGRSAKDAWNMLCDRLQRDPQTSEETDTCSLRAACRAMIAFAESPEPVPATNQAGEALALIREMADPDLQGVSISLHRTWQKQALRIAALDTHAATPQAGEVERSDDEVIAEFAFLYHAYGIEADDKLAPDALELKRKVLAALATQPATSQEGEALATIASALRDFDAAKIDSLTVTRRIGNALHMAGAKWDNKQRRYIFAATPTPPTLSEDLREVALVGIERIMREGIHENDGPNRIWINGVAHEGPVADFTIRTFRKVGEIARAALAQVKAS